MTLGWRDEKAEPEAVNRVLGQCREVLDCLSISNRWPGRLLFATSVAQRTFDWHDQLPPDQRRPYSEMWRPCLADLWDYAAGDETKFYGVSESLGRFYLSPQNHNEGQDGAGDADTPEVAATFYAANCALHGLTEFAILAAARALEGIDTAWFGADETRRVAETGAELSRQAADAQVIKNADTDPWSSGRRAELVQRLRST